MKLCAFRCARDALLQVLWQANGGGGHFFVPDDEKTL
jgi:hypothetical protein